MILYFTGTGNSRYIANAITSITKDELVSINEKIKTKDTQAIQTDGRLVFVLPTYGWRIPRVVEEWVRKTEFTGVEKVWFIMNCGSGIGNGAGYIQKLCREKSFFCMGTMGITMPENYIAMFQTPDKQEAATIIKKADPVIKEAGQMIAEGKAYPDPNPNILDKFLSTVVNPVFYKVFVKADGFYAKDSCIGCGKCQEICPLQNIKMKDGKPEWGKDCTHCMACISRCPAEAIEYGRKSVGKRRYYC